VRGASASTDAEQQKLQSGATESRNGVDEKAGRLHSGGGFAECWRHCPSSFDQLMALT
jgi:hypothetical protein